MDSGEWMAGKNSDVRSKETGRGKAGELDGVLTATGFCLVGGAKLQGAVQAQGSKQTESLDEFLSLSSHFRQHTTLLQKKWFQKTN